MSTLYLCRHAEAVDADDELPDEDRFLTARGRSDAQKVGAALARFGERPELILTSPLVRAVQTAEGLALAFDAAIESLRDLAPGGQLSNVLAMIIERGAESTSLVGHEPMMGDWASLLLGHRFPRAFVKGAVLRLDFDREPALGEAKARFFLTTERLEKERLRAT